MKQLKRYTFAGILFVLVLGTIAHFIYEWSGNNLIAGLFTPVNESPWEHMKLIFFPMLLYSLFLTLKLQNSYPCIAASFSAGILLGTVCIPVIFFLYIGILGQDVFILDILIFILSVVIGFYAAYRLTLSCRVQKYKLLLYCLLVVAALCFGWFSYHPAPYMLWQFSGSLPDL